MMRDWWVYDGTLLYGLSHDARLVELCRITGGWRIAVHESIDPDLEMVAMHVDLTDGAAALDLFRFILGVKTRRKRWHPSCEGEQ